MNKNQLIAAIASKADCSKEVASACCDAMLDCIMDAMKGGEKVLLPGFGNFEVKVRAAREGINPATREKIQIPESKVVSFKHDHSSKDSL